MELYAPLHQTNGAYFLSGEWYTFGNVYRYWLLCVMKSPRVQVSIPQLHYESLKRFCQLNGCSMSSYLSELVIASVPVLDVLSAKLAAASAVRQEVEMLSSNPFLGAVDQLDMALENAVKMLVAHPAQASPSVCAGDGAGTGCGNDAGKNELTPLLLTGGLGKTKNDQYPIRGIKNKHMWLAASNREGE